MQADNTNGVNIELAEVLTQLPVTDTTSTIEMLLDIVVRLTGGAGASVVRVGDTLMNVSRGDATLWGDVKQVSIDWIRQLSSQGEVGRQLPFDVTASSWFTYRLSDHVVLFGWFAHETSTTEELLASVAPVTVVLNLAVQAHLANRRQERANLLANSVIDSILDPLLVLKDDRTVLMMNVAAEELFGVKTDVAWGQHVSDVVKADDLMILLDREDEYGNGRRPPEWTTGETSELTYLPFLSVVHTPNGAPDGWVLALRDVSRFKRLNRNQREFMRIVSHDLRSPLTAMQGFADMIRMGMVGDLTEKQAYFVDKILSGVSQMTSIVDNIQDAGRFDPETGFYEMQRSQVDLSEIVSKIVSNQIIPAEKQNLTVEMAVADNVPIINADENMLTRAVTNLVDNAVKYTPDAGRIEVQIRQDDAGNVVVSVIDDGDGISEEDQAKLFQRHVRLAKREHVRVKGTGLGLFIVKSVAQAHGGDAVVESVLSEGTTFSIVIPLSGSNLIRS